jgi:predicted lipoprotein with Yx(FWY)xxD motif
MFKMRMLVFLLCVVVLALPALAQDDPPTVSLGESDLGEVLIGPDGMTLYIFTPDPVGSSVCYERCAELWPPLLVRNADSIVGGDDLPGELGTIERTTGTVQVTYNGLPLYYWWQDVAQGQTRGHGVGNVWWVGRPSTVYISHNAELGNILVGPTGNTVYRFDNDAPGVSNCSGDCAANWPPLTVESESVVADFRLPGELGTIAREDGTLQVTYNGWPLYYWKDDAARGDVTGEGVGDVWWTVVPESVLMSSNDELGDMLTGANGMTLYTFANDEAGVSNCTGDCATNWPPLTIGEGDRVAASAGIEGEWGVIEREDGSRQVTYNGMPLYFFAEDEAPGDTNGQGRGDVWFVAAP